MVQVGIWPGNLLMPQVQFKEKKRGVILHYRLYFADPILKHFEDTALSSGFYCLVEKYFVCLIVVTL